MSNAAFESETLESLLPKCRVCLNTSGCIDIFESPKLAECLQSCASMIVDVRDNFPRKVCRSCNRLIQSVITLKTLIIAAEEKLRSLQFNQHIRREELECTPDIFVNTNRLVIDESVLSSDTNDDFTTDSSTFHCASNGIKNKEVKKVTQIDNSTIDKLKKKNKPKVKKESDSENNLSDSSVDKGNKFRCKVCKKFYKSQKSLYLHERYHNTEKCHHCMLCMKSFATKGDLTKHHRVHTGEKPFQCDVCMKKFSQNVTLKSHMEIHKRNSEFSKNDT